jgi:hypothetical protein
LKKGGIVEKRGEEVSILLYKKPTRPMQRYVASPHLVIQETYKTHAPLCCKSPSFHTGNLPDPYNDENFEKGMIYMKI